jgi:hypothetical protein|tara:strand:- start:1843 stop:2019 length:177 start_codon:yes stop_codon:yes gene_type:complete
MNKDELKRRRDAHEIGVADLKQAYKNRGMSDRDADKRARSDQERYSNTAEQQANERKR